MKNKKEARKTPMDEIARPETVEEFSGLRLRQIKMNHFCPLETLDRCKASKIGEMLGISVKQTRI